MSRLPQPSRQALLAGLFLAVFAAVSAWLRIGQTVEKPYDLRSADGSGLLALKWWIESMGYRVATNDGPHFEVPSGAALLFVYPGDERYSDADVDRVLAWTNAGGTLAIVGPGQGQSTLAARLGVSAEEVAGVNSLSLDSRRRLWQAQPLIPDGPSEIGRLGAGPALEFDQDRAAVAALTTDLHQVTLAVQPRGKGWVWHLSPRHDLTNADLRDELDGLIVPALLRAVPKQGLVVFDTYHQSGPTGTRSVQAIHSVGDWLRQSWGGRALLILVSVVFIFRWWGGMRLGPSLVTAFESPRREAAEFVTAMADLYRRGRQTRSVAAYHKQRLKRGLGRVWQIGADLPDDAFVERVRIVDPGFSEADAAAVSMLLARLGATSDEAELVTLVNQADRFVPPEKPVRLAYH